MVISSSSSCPGAHHHVPGVVNMQCEFVEEGKNRWMALEAVGQSCVVNMQCLVMEEGKNRWMAL